MNDDVISERIDAAIACIHAGLMTVTEAADEFDLAQSMLWKRCKALGFRPAEQRNKRLRKIMRAATFRKWKLPSNWRKSHKA